MSIREQLAINLAYYRKKAGYTQKTASASLGTKLTTLSSWERGVSQPNADMLVSIAFLYHASLSELCGLDYELKITKEERELITAYRKHPEQHAAIRKLLDIETKESEILRA